MRQIKKFLLFYKLPFIYFIIGVSWIKVTDLLVQQNGFASSDLQTYKGIFFVSVTTLMLSIIIYKHHKIKEVEEEKEKLSTLINGMSDLVIFKDDEGKWLEVNHYGHQLFNLNKDDYVGKTNTTIQSKFPHLQNILTRCATTDKQAWENNRTILEIIEFTLSNGNTRIFEITKVPLQHSSKKKRGLFVIGKDITEMKKNEEMLLKREKLAVVGELAAGIAHEIRNPLTTLKGFVQLFKKDANSTTSTTNYYDLMDSELDRIHTISSELLSIAKPQKMNFKENDIREIIKSVILFIESEAHLNGLEIILDYPESLPFIKCEEDQLRQVFINVLKNAMEASERGSKIEVTVKREKDRVIATIKDYGCGIPESRLKRIGEPFFTMKEKGTGLGMTVSFKIIEAHRGKITINSQVKRGTEVNICIPI